MDKANHDSGHRWIFHVDMDAFFVSVEQVLDPELRGKPVIVGGDPNSRGVVAAASYEVRRFGVHSAMPVSRAKQLCPQAIFVRGHYDEYQRVSNEIRAIFEDITPLVEMVSIDEAYLDMTGFDRLYGPMISVAEQLRQRILDKTGCSASVGIAANKLAAKVGSDYAKPAGIFFLRPGYEAAFFSHLDVGKIPGIGGVTADRLRSLGVQTAKDLTRIGRDVLEMTMGRSGLVLYAKALGQGNDELSAPRLPKSVGNETTFDEDTVDREFIESTLSYLTEKAATRMRRHQLKARKVSLKLRYSDFQTITRDITFPTPTDIDCEIFTVVLTLFHRAFSRRMRVRLVGVTLSHLVPGPWQLPIPLFHPGGDERWREVFNQVDRVRGKYGFTMILNGHSALVRSPRSRVSTVIQEEPAASTGEHASR